MNQKKHQLHHKKVNIIKRSLLTTLHFQLTLGNEPLDNSMIILDECSGDNSEGLDNEEDCIQHERIQKDKENIKSNSDDDDFIVTQTLILEEKILHKIHMKVRSALEAVTNRKKERELKDIQRQKKEKEEEENIVRNELQAKQILKDLEMVLEENKEIAER